MDTLGDWFLLAFVVSLFALTIVYGTMSQWYSSIFGKLFFTEHLIILGLMTQVLASVFNNSNYPGRDPLRSVLYGGSTLVVLGLICVVLLVQRHSRRKRRELLEVEVAEANQDG